MIGYDIDGVLSSGTHMLPEGGFVVISGRTWAEYDELCKRLASVAPVYIRGSGAYGDRLAAGRFKALMIHELGVEEFHEDDPLQAEIIEAATGIKVVMH